MPAERENKFARARHHLRSTHLLEGPTNNTSGYFTIEPEVFETIPAVRAALNLGADDSSLVGKDTSGLFDNLGNSLAEGPPGDSSYILGPMVSVYFPDGDYSAIGYIQKDTRKVINLARIPGTVSGWGIGGNVEGFTSYSQLTLEQALWYRDKLINGNTSSYRVFYIGVFEQLNSENPNVTDDSAGVDVDEYGRWIGDIIDAGYVIDPETKKLVKKGKKGPDPDMPPGIANPIVQKLKDKLKKGENLTIDDFPSAADFSAFKNGGGNAALRDGKTIGDVIRQGIININGADSGARLADFDDYMGPAFGNDSVANSERQKAVDARNDAIYDYWKNNYKPDKSVNPDGLTQKQIDDMPDWYKDVSTHPDPKNYTGGFKDTPVGQAVNDFMYDPTHGWWRQAVLDFGVGAISQAVGRPGGSMPTPRRPTIGATGMNQPGYRAITGGERFQVPQGGGLIGKGSRPILGRGAYSADQVGQVGPGGLRPGSGASRYAQPGGGVVGSIVPPGARGTRIIEPQKVVSGPTFDKGRDLASRVAKGQYPNSSSASRTRQDMIDAGFPKGQSSISYDQLPQKPSMKPNGKSFDAFSRAALGAGAAFGASELLAPSPAEGARNLSSNEGQSRLQGKLGSEFSLGDKIQAGGDHVRYPILQNGKPVIDPRTNKPREVGGGVRGGRVSGSFESGIDDFVRDYESGFKGDVQKGKPSGTTRFDNTTKKPITRTASKVQPKPTKRTTIRSMPASMMGKPPVSKPQVQRPEVNPLNTDPYKLYNPSKGSSQNLQKSLGRFNRGYMPKGPIRFSHELEGQMLAENRSRILREVKKPYQLPEVKTEKVKYRPKVNKTETRSVGDGLMKKAEVPTSFKRLEDSMWKKQDRHWNERHSQERKNMILDTVGTSDHAWEYITDRSASGNDAKMYEHFGNGIKNQIIEKKKIGNDYIIKMYNEQGKVETVTQSILNERLQRQYELKEQETIYAPKDPLVARIRNKLYSQIDYPNKPAKLGYPDEPPKQMIGGYHPDFGDRHSYYNRLDRHSADTMQNAPTKDLKIDGKVQKQTTRQKALNIVNNIRSAKAEYAKATKKNK
jgi:hypothetical protein